MRKHFKNFFEALFFVGMFFTGYSDNGLGIYMDADSDEGDYVQLYLKSKSEDHICFNVMNFVINTYRALPGEPEEADAFLKDMGDQKYTVSRDISVSGYLPYMYQKLHRLGQDIVQELEQDWMTLEADSEHEVAKLKDLVERRYGRTPRIQDNLIRKLDDAERKYQHAKAWRMLAQAVSFDGVEFAERWKRVLRNTTEHLFKKFQKWENVHGRHKLVLPVENFDMMYNIVKRLASVYYHDIPEEASVEAVYNCYVHLYKGVLKELELQDRAYYGDTPECGFAKVLRDSVFYQEVVEADGKRHHSEFLREILTNMIASAISTQNSRLNAKAIDFLL